MTADTTALVRSFLDELDQLPSEIPGAQHLDPGRLAWLHGNNKGRIKEPGVFYAKDVAFTDAPGEPWVLDERYSDQSELGYSATELRIAFLGWRDQWFEKNTEDRSKPPRWLAAYQDGASKLTEYLVMVEGLNEPMVLSVSGLHKATPIAKIVSEYKRGALAQAMRKIKRTLPLWSFWLPIANRRDRDGKTIYDEAKDAKGATYGSIVTPPALASAPIPRSAGELLADAEVWQSYREAGWFDYKRLPQGTIEGRVTVQAYAPPALPPGKNVPVAIEAEEIDAF